MNKFIESIGGMFDKITIFPNNELKLAFFGGILIIVVFLIAWLISLGSRMNGLRKKLLAITKKLSVMERIDEENVNYVYDEIQKLPEPTAQVWGRYLDQRVGYPSDYVAARDVLERREYSGKRTVGKVVYSVLSVIIWALCAVIMVGLCKGDLSQVGIADFTKDFSLVASILFAVIIPVAVFVIFYFVLDFIYGRQRKRLELSFTSFQDMLDEKVVVNVASEYEYYDDDIEDIGYQVDDLIQGRMDDDGIIEVGNQGINIKLVIGDENDYAEEEISAVQEAPVNEVKAEEAHVSEIAPVEEPVKETIEEIPAEEEIVEENSVTETGAGATVEEYAATETEEYYPVDEAAAEETVREVYIPLTKEEAERYLSVLLVIVDQAMTDPDTTDEDLEEIAVLIETARQEAFREEADQAILEECLIKLASRWSK